MHARVFFSLCLPCFWLARLKKTTTFFAACQPVDMWSMGVITYFLIAGYPPFYDRKTTNMLRRAKIGDFKFIYEDWTYTSDAAKVRWFYSGDEREEKRRSLRLHPPYKYLERQQPGEIRAARPYYTVLLDITVRSWGAVRCYQGVALPFFNVKRTD